MKDFLNFDNMLTPKLIVILYYLGLIGLAIAAVFYVLGGGVLAVYTGNFLHGVGVILAGAVAIVVGALWLRVVCELMIVLFKMNEALQEMRKK